jgi:type III restriction enzyme
MQLKDYQQTVLDDLRRYLAALEAERAEAHEVAAFLRGKGKQAEIEDWCEKAWRKLGDAHRLPTVTGPDGPSFVPPWIGRRDGLGEPIPNVCLKVPTGGGKTLLATGAVELIQTEFFRRQTGFVLWVVPSDAIYRQTWAALANREHPYRQRLERASAGRVKLLEKGDAFTPLDVEHYLCVMLVMLQAGAVRQDSREKRKMFQDAGKFPGFFPEVDDVPAQLALLARVPNLDAFDDELSRHGSIKQSLGNVLRLVRPLVIVDEGHKAYSATARGTLQGFNPRFMLELSATPNSGNERLSNVLVAVGGAALQREQMIKLPINLENFSNADWKHTLAQAVAKLDELQTKAVRVRGNENRPIRPILIARVERTGKDQRDGLALHAEDVREHLITQLGAKPDEVRVKSAELDELDRVELLAETCPVRFIITKAALQEGWDCPFAYVLALLDATAARTAITQMVGRILRQPGARATSEPALNECYVFTFNQAVQEAVEQVRRGLQSEGLGDLGEFIRLRQAGAAGTARRVAIPRREAWRGRRIFLPRVLSRHPETGQWREFDYERDLLSRIPWATLKSRQGAEFVPDPHAALERSRVRVDTSVLHADGKAPVVAEVQPEEVEARLDVPALTRLLLDVVPNPWQAVRILRETLAALAQRNFTEAVIFPDRLRLMKQMREDLQAQVEAEGERIFRELLAAGDLAFRLETSGDERLNWELAETLEIDLLPGDQELYRENGAPLERSLMEKIYVKQLNGLERNAAWYLDGAQAVRWWHRIAARQDWHLQGWKRTRVYPDFLVCLEASDERRLRLTVLETKGLHLQGSEDTQYKERLFELLTRHAQSAIPAGELKLGLEAQQMRFELLLENNWEDRIGASLD